MKLSREIKTAILVISSILLFIWGYSFLKGKDLLNEYKTVYVLYDNVEGLNQSAVVTFNGLQIGKVSSISFLNAERKNLVEIQIKGNYPISKSSIAKIYEPGFIGGKQIMIIPDYDDPNMVKNKDYLKGEVKSGITSELAEKLVPLQGKIEHMIANADSLLSNLNQVLNAKTKENIRSSIEHLNATLTEFSKISKDVNSLVAENKTKFSNTASNLEKITSNFSKVSDSLAQANLGKTIKDLENTLASVNQMMGDIQQGKGTMGKLMKDDKMYDHLVGASKELEQLLGDMKRNPKRYVHFSLFGKKPDAYQESKQ